jgi:hypothetical protein
MCRTVVNPSMPRTVSGKDNRKAVFVLEHIFCFNFSKAKKSMQKTKFALLQFLGLFLRIIGTTKYFSFKNISFHNNYLSNFSILTTK